MKLRKIFVVRHADFIHSGEDGGNDQSEALANRLERFIDDPKSIVVLTSPLDRAWLTAKPTCRKFGLQTYVESDILRWIEREDAKKAPQALELIEEHGKETEIIVMITHKDYLDWLPAQIAKKYLGIGFTGGDRGYARGWGFNLETKEIEEI